MADQPTSAADVAEIVKERDVRFIRLWFTDVLGQLKSFSINSSELADAFEGGMGFDGSSITGFNPIEESDMIAMPDPATFALIPWRPEEENAVARMFCDIRVPGGDPYEGDPRWIMRRALKRAEEMGFEAYNIGPELEFFYFKSAKPEGGAPEVLDPLFDRRRALVAEVRDLASKLRRLEAATPSGARQGALDELRTSAARLGGGIYSQSIEQLGQAHDAGSLPVHRVRQLRESVEADYQRALRHLRPSDRDLLDRDLLEDSQ